MGVFPDRSSVYRLIGTQLMNIDEDWRSGRRHMVKEGIKKLFEQETENNANNNNFILDEVFKQCLGDVVFRNNAISQGSDCDHVRRRAPDHRLRSSTDLQRFTGAFIDRHPGRFVNDNALAPNIDQCVSCAKVNSQVL